MAQGNFGGDTGDSFLANIDSMMGAPPLKGGKGGSGGGGDSLIQGIFKALGIGNKDITGPVAKTEGGDSIVTKTATPPNPLASADTAAALAPSAAASQNQAAASGNLLSHIFKAISG